MILSGEGLASYLWCPQLHYLTGKYAFSLWSLKLENTPQGEYSNAMHMELWRRFKPWSQGYDATAPTTVPPLLYTHVVKCLPGLYLTGNMSHKEKYKYKSMGINKLISITQF